MFFVYIPLIGAFASFIAGRYNKRLRDVLVCLFLITEAALTGRYLFAGLEGTFKLANFCGFGLHLNAGGFRMLYAFVASFLWAVTGVFGLEYFASHYRNRNRYYFFLLLTQCGTVGLFLSADLYTAFVFFELMSMASYPFVAHDETKEAMRAAQTYIVVAIIGGMVTLMGLFLLYAKTASFDSALLADGDKYLVGTLICVGFAAKAGVFPLHIWLPKAHPVAPAPASALLSGVLTKCGMYGLLIISCTMFAGDERWGNALLIFAIATMFIGALLALLSVQLKRTLACSSMSQIGFILTGVAMRCLLGEEGGLAGSGAVMHMVNHSLIKLCLFQCAGAVYMRTHSLDLNEIRGFGRKYPALNIAFLLGAIGIMGIPLGNGFISKSLIHEGIVEYIAEAPADLYGWYKAAEWLFLISGGMTVAYMTKLYVCLFIDKRPEDSPSEAKPFTVLTNAVLLLSGAICLVLGLFPDAFLGKAADLSSGFLGLEGFKGAEYFSWENLKGALISVSIGAILYVSVVRCLLMKNGTYLNRLPVKADLEDAFYRPWFERILPNLGLFAARVADEIADAGALVLMTTVFKAPKEKKVPIFGSRFVYRLGSLLNGFATLLNWTVKRNNPIKLDFVAVLAATSRENSVVVRRVTRSVSFGLLLLCCCMLGIFIYILAR